MPGSRGLVSKEVMFDFCDDIRISVNKPSNYGCRGDTGNNHNPPLEVSFNKTTPVLYLSLITSRVLRPRTSKVDERTTDYIILPWLSL